jgi:cobalt/nickel transport system permease protein
MHIADGIINLPVSIAANVASISIAYVFSRHTESDHIPKMGMIGSALFVASLIHFPLVGTSLHLGLFGLAGIILGQRSYPVVFAVLLMQSLIFQHGGLLSVGINSINMGIGSLAAWLIWQQRKLPEVLRSVLAGFCGIFLPACLMATLFQISGYGKSIFYLLSIYLVAAIVESGITLSAVLFLRKIKSDILPQKTYPS